jgi:hypothetical protein
MKSDVEITEEVATLIEKVTGVKVEPTSVEKASYNTIRKQLEEAIKKFNLKEYSWSYVEDFDDQYVVFSASDGLFYTTYETTTEGVTVGDTATSVNRVVSYREDTGTLILSEDNSLNTSVQSLIVKSFDALKGNEKLVDVIKSIQEKGKKMEVEIQKAVDTATAQLKTDLEKATGDLKAAQETIAELQKAATEAKESIRKEQIASVIKDAKQAEDLLKATAVLDDASFDTILKGFKDKVEVIEKGDLFERKSSQTDIEKSDAEPLHVKMLKKQHNVTQ